MKERERVAIIDLGSNSARLIVVDIDRRGAYNLVYNQKETVRLGEGLAATGQLQEAAMRRAVGTLQVFAHMNQLFKVDKVLAVATAAVRNAKNGADFLRQAKKETGIPLRVISGEAEAKLGYLGVVNTLDIEEGIVFDLGGASTELTLIKGRKAQTAVSMPFGAVTLTEYLGARPNEKKLLELQNHLWDQLVGLSWLKDSGVPLIGIGGTARNIAKMDQRKKGYPFPKVHNYRLGKMAFQELYRGLAGMTLAQRRKVPGLSNERADIIVPGLAIVNALFDITSSQQFLVSGCGVREGLFMQYYQSRHGEGELVRDILEHSTHNMMLSYNLDETHAQHVASLADQLWQGWGDRAELGARERRLLRVSALLHDIGISINYYDHPRHSAYLVENARLFGLTHREQMLCAVMAGWHNGLSMKYVRNRMYSEFLDEGDWMRARKLSLLLAVAEALDTTQMQLVRRVKAGFDLENGLALLELELREAAVIEQENVNKLKKAFKKEFNLELTVMA